MAAEENVLAIGLGWTETRPDYLLMSASPNVLPWLGNDTRDSDATRRTKVVVNAARQM